MKSPLRYPGGKTRAIKILKNYIPVDCKEICSPFFGGGSFELYLVEQGIKIHGYDNFKPLISFWKSLKGSFPLWCHVDEIHQNMNKELFYQMQKEVLNEQNEYKQGAMFYALNRSSFSGSTLSGGMSPNWVRFTKKSVEYIDSEDVSKTFGIYGNDLITVNLLPFEESIRKHQCLIFADPPYYINQNLYGNRGDMHRDFNHKLLAKLLLEHWGGFILTYNDCPEIRELYKGCEIDKIEWAYGMNKTKKSNEIIITNYKWN